MKRIFLFFVPGIFIFVHSFSQTNIPAGYVSGTWTAASSPYIIDGEIKLDTNDQLIIEPGVEVEFTGHYKFIIHGRLLAIGTETDSIYFTAQNTADGWHGLRFDHTDLNGQDSSKLEYCRLDYGKAFGLTLADSLGGAIRCDSSSQLLIKNSCLENNISLSDGGGIYLYKSNILIKRSLIHQNEAYGKGGGIKTYHSSIELYDVIISLNEAKTFLGFGGGMSLENNASSFIKLNNVLIEDNWAQERGGGIHSSNYAIAMSIDSCIIRYNGASQSGGGIYGKFNTISAKYFILRQNSAGYASGMLLQSCNNATIQNMVIYYHNASDGIVQIYNSNNLRLQNITILECYADQGSTIYIGENSDVVISNSIVRNEDTPVEIQTYENGNVSVEYSNIEGGFTGTGNIDKNPLLTDPENGDYRLSWSHFPEADSTKSPCIDTGDPLFINPDGTRSDMGAIPYEHTYTPLNSGDISGTLLCSESPYYVYGNLSVPIGEELIIEPCVYVIFQDDYYLEVKGRLLAEGNSTDKITFYPSDSETGWQGIRFYNLNSNGQDSSKLVHCRILNGNANGYNQLSHGGGVFASQSSKLVIDSCFFSGNRSLLSGGGICLLGGCSPDIRNSTFVNNSARMGGGVGCYDNIFTNFLNCSFSNNTAEYGGAISASACGPSFSGLTIFNNHALRFGGGIYRDGGQSISFDETNRCNIYDNYADFAGLDFYSAKDVYVPPVTTIYLDTATVDQYNEHLAFPIHLFEVNSNYAKFVQESSDLYVSPTGSDMNAGTSPSDPLRTIKMALIKIVADDLNPKTIYLADGVYNKKESGEMFPINHKSHVTLSGENRNNTIINGESLYQLMTSYTDTNDFVKNITFQNGYKDGDGGALVIEYYSNPTFNNVTFQNNYCEHDGGAVWCFDNCNPVFSHVSFINDSSSNAGGAMFCQSIDTILLDSVTFSYNKSLNSGGALQVDATDKCLMSRCEFNNNTLTNGAGGGACIRNTKLVADDVTFIGNHVTGSGGAFFGYGAELNFYNSRFYSNTASGTGGGIRFYLGVDLNMENVTFLANSSTSGGAIWGYYNSTIDIKNGLFVGNNTFYDPYNIGNGGALNLQGVTTYLTNITLVNNTAEGDGGGISFWSPDPGEIHSVQNSIFWGNVPDQIYLDYNATAEVNYCNIEGGWASGLGNINQSPSFTSSGTGDYSLSSDSPCINVGNPDTIGLNLPVFDIIGNPRISLDTIDMGAYEHFSGIELDLMVFLEGPFNGTAMNTDIADLTILPIYQPFNSSPWNYSGTEEIISAFPENTVDWILLQARDTTFVSLATPECIMGQQAVFLLSNGSIVNINGNNPKFGNPINHNCYVAILHRNHLGILSASPLSESVGIYSYDFSASLGQAYNSGQKSLGGGIYGMIGGDANADGTIDELDITSWKNMAGESGYLKEDLQLKGQVENQDKNEVWLPNVGSSTEIPD